jgi:SAM-dependent methyltransferase
MTAFQPIAGRLDPVLADSRGNQFALRQRSCPVCNAETSKELGLRGGEHQRYGLGIETRIVRCDSCQLIFPNPFPYPLSFDALYGDPDAYFGEADLEPRISSCRRLVREIVKRVGREDIAILDVGAGRGEFLAAAKREGVRAVGIEPSGAMVAQGKERLGVEIHCQTIDEFVREEREIFDVVTLSGVLEHVHDPNSLMAAVATLLARAGLLYIDVPREPNLLTILGNAWNALRGSPAIYNLQPTWPPYHVLGFNPGSIRLLLSRHGFGVDELRVHSDPHVPARNEWKDRLRAFVGTQVQRVSNYTNLASNMYIWCRRR